MVSKSGQLVTTCSKLSERMFAAVWSIDSWASVPDCARPARVARENARSMSSSAVGVVGRSSKIMSSLHRSHVKRPPFQPHLLLRSPTFFCAQSLPTVAHSLAKCGSKAFVTPLAPCSRSGVPRPARSHPFARGAITLFPLPHRGSHMPPQPTALLVRLTAHCGAHPSHADSRSTFAFRLLTGACARHRTRFRSSALVRLPTGQSDVSRLPTRIYFSTDYR